MKMTVEGWAIGWVVLGRSEDSGDENDTFWLEAG